MNEEQNKIDVKVDSLRTTADLLITDQDKFIQATGLRTYFPNGSSFIYFDRGNENKPLDYIVEPDNHPTDIKSLFLEFASVLETNENFSEYLDILITRLIQQLKEVGEGLDNPEIALKFQTAIRAHELSHRITRIRFFDHYKTPSDDDLTKAEISTGPNEELQLLENQFQTLNEVLADCESIMSIVHNDQIVRMFY